MLPPAAAAASAGDLTSPHDLFACPLPSNLRAVVHAEASRNPFGTRHDLCCMRGGVRFVFVLTLAYPGFAYFSSVLPNSVFSYLELFVIFTNPNLVFGLSPADDIGHESYV